MSRFWVCIQVQAPAAVIHEVMQSNSRQLYNEQLIVGSDGLDMILMRVLTSPLQKQLWDNVLRTSTISILVKAGGYWQCRCANRYESTILGGATRHRSFLSTWISICEVFISRHAKHKLRLRRSQKRRHQSARSRVYTKDLQQGSCSICLSIWYCIFGSRTGCRVRLVGIHLNFLLGSALHTLLNYHRRCSWQ